MDRHSDRGTSTRFVVASVTWLFLIGHPGIRVVHADPPVVLTGDVTVGRASYLYGLDLAGYTLSLGSAQPANALLTFTNSAQSILGAGGSIVFNFPNHQGEILADGSNVTIGAGVTIRTGTGDGVLFGDQFHGGQWINHGIVASDVVGRQLSLNQFTNASDGLVHANQGTVQFYDFANAGTVQLSNSSVSIFHFSSNTGTMTLQNVQLDLVYGNNVPTLLSMMRTGGSLTISGDLANPNTFNFDDVGFFALNGPINGGTIVTSKPDAFSISGFGALNNVTLASPLNIPYGQPLGSLGLTLKNVPLRIGSATTPNAPGRLHIGDLYSSASGTLDGSGQVLFSGAGPGELNLNPGSSIGAGISIATEVADGVVNFGTNSVNHASIAVTKGRTLTLNAAGPLLNDGTLRVDAGSTLVVGNTWPLNYLGTVSRDPASRVIFQGAITVPATTVIDLTQTSIGAMELGSGVYTGGIFTSPGHVITPVMTGNFVISDKTYWYPVFDGSTIDANVEVPISDGLGLKGNGLTLPSGTTISLSDGALAFFESTTLRGTGQVVFNGSTTGRIVGNIASNLAFPVLTVQNGITIRTGKSGGSIAGSGTVINHGLISSETPNCIIRIGDSTNLGTFTNDGTIQAINGGILELSSPWTNTGTIRSDASSIRVTGTKIRPADLQGLTFANHSILGIDGYFNNDNSTLIVADANRTVHLGPNSYFTGGAITSPTGDALIIDGDSRFKGPSSNSAILNNLLLTTPVQIPAHVALSLNGVDNRGAVTVNGGTLNLFGTACNNSGSIDAFAGALISIGTMPTSVGHIALTNSTLQLNAPLSTVQLLSFTRTNTPLDLAGGGVLSNTGSTLYVDGAAGPIILYGGTVVGGSVASSLSTNQWLINQGTLDGVTLASDVNLSDYATVAVKNGLTLNSAHFLLHGQSSTFQLVGTQTLGGTGEIVFDTAPLLRTSPPNQFPVISPSSGSTLSIATGVTIRTGAGPGQIGSTNATIINNGTIFSQKTAPIATVPGVAITRGTFTNNGTLAAAQGGTLQVAKTVSFTNFVSGVLTGGRYEIKDNSTFDFAGRSIINNAATVVVSGPGSRFDELASLTTNSGQLAFLAGRNFSAVSDLLNSGTLTVGDGSTLVIPAGHTLTNTGTLTGGGTIVGNVLATGVVSPGASPGLLTINGDFAETASSVLNIEIGPASLSRRTDVIAISGSANIGGTLNVIFYDGYSPSAADPLTINFLTAGNILAGSFDTINLPTLPAGMLWDTSRAAEGQIVLTPEPYGGAAILLLFVISSRRRPHVRVTLPQG
jgi:hypothetical protein